MRFASRPGVSWLNDKVLPPLDRVASRMTGGRATLTSVVSGIPVLWLITIGARSGAERTVPLLAFPIGDGLGLIGTRFGQQATPAWVHNLEANPEARVRHGDTEIPARARPAEPNEEAELWSTAAAVYPGYAAYTERAAHRRIRVFVLEPSDEIGTGRPRVGS